MRLHVRTVETDPVLILNIFYHLIAGFANAGARGDVW